MKSLLPLILLCLAGSHGFPTSLKTKKHDMQMVQEYLEKFYDLKVDRVKFDEKKKNSLITEKLKKMQKFFGLSVTGKPDSKTLKMMKQSRCGVPDVPYFAITEGNPKWEKKDITYSIENYTPDLTKEDVDNAIEKAFKVWSDVSPLTFTKISEGEADIKISFAHRDHYDNSPFDGPGGILAHAFQPGPHIGGDAHFDEDESWTKDHRYYNLFRVAAHEFGHSLGLGHSSDISALMFPTFSFVDVNDIQVSQDDIDGIQAIYGPTNNYIQPTGPTLPQACDERLTFDAITTLRGEKFFLKDRFYFRISYASSTPEMNYFSVFWPNLPSRIEAAYENTVTDVIRFFKGNKLWAYSATNELPGYPKDIYSTLGFPANVRNIDAAVFDYDTEKTYFFVDNMYWSYDESSQSMDTDNPKMIANDFPGITTKVDAVFQENGFFYFFSGTTQYKFEPYRKRVVALLKTNSWFNC